MYSIVKQSVKKPAYFASRIQEEHHDERRSSQGAEAASQKFPNKNTCEKAAFKRQGQRRNQEFVEAKEEDASTCETVIKRKTVARAMGDSDVQPEVRDVSNGSFSAFGTTLTQGGDEEESRVSVQEQVVPTNSPHPRALPQAQLAQPLDMEEEIKYLRAENERLQSSPTEIPTVQAEIDKESSMSKKKIHICVAVGVLVAIAIAVGVTVAITTSSNSSSDTTGSNNIPEGTSAPTPIPLLPDGPWIQLGQTLNGEQRLDWLGTSISLSRNASVMAVGANQINGGTGYVLVLRFDESTQSWSRLGQELHERQAGFFSFGSAVSFNGDGTILAVGAGHTGSHRGHVRVYKYNTASDFWVKYGNDLDGYLNGDRFGASISLSDNGDFIAIGASGDDTLNGGRDVGTVHTFRYSQRTSSWVKHGQKLSGTMARDSFGSSVSLSSSGRVMAIRASPTEVHMYQYNSTAADWSPMGLPIISVVADGQFGHVCLDDSGFVLAVGEVWNLSEHVLVFAYDSNTSMWNPQGQIIRRIQEQRNGDISVSLSGNGRVVALGSNSANSGQGEVGIFQYNENTKEWAQVGELLKGENANRQPEHLGYSVSLSQDGSAVAIGANERAPNGIPRAGSAFVFTLYPSTGPGTVTSKWLKLGEEVTGNVVGDNFGGSVSISRDGMIIAVGATQYVLGTGEPTKPGYISIFRLNESTQSWTPMGQRLLGQTIGENFGDHVSLNGDGTILAAGVKWNAIGGSYAGSVRVYEYKKATDVWVQLGSDIVGEGDRHFFGVSLSLSANGDILAVGASGAVSVRLFRYDHDMSTWNPLGPRLIGESRSSFGTSVSLSSSGETVAVGAYRMNFLAGQVTVYDYNPETSTWDQKGGPINGEPFENFGRVVSLDKSGLVLAVGATSPTQNSKDNVRVYAYDRVTSAWSQLGQTLSPPQSDEDLDISLSLSGNGNVLAIGGRRHDSDDGLLRAGQVIIFQYDTNTMKWIEEGALTGDTSYTYFGSSVSLSENGTVVVVGAPYHESGTAHVFSFLK